MLLLCLRVLTAALLAIVIDLAPAQSSANLPEAPARSSDLRPTPSDIDISPSAQQGNLPEIHALLSSGDWKDAENRCRSTLAVDPASAEASYLLAYSLYREGKAAESLSAYTAAARLRRPQAEDLMAVAADYAILADYKDADRWFTRATELAPGNALAWYYRGRAEYKLEEYAAAKAAFGQSLKLDPQSARAEDNLGLAFKMLGDQAKAQARFRSAVQLESKKPSGYSLPWLNLGSLLVEQDDLKAGIPYLEKAVALSPQNPKAHEQLGRAYVQTGQYVLAEHELQVAVAEAPNAPSLHFLLGRVYQKEGKGDEAAKEFQRTSSLNAKQTTSEVPDLLGPAPK